MKTLYKIQEYLVGKKTYLLSVLTALYVVLRAFDVIDFTFDQEQAVNLLILALFGTTLRLGISKK